jgi:hypothetical protein
MGVFDVERFPALLIYFLLLHCSIPTSSEWRRGDLNPSPVTTSEAASTCIVDVLISIPATIIDILRRHPVVLISPSDQRPNQKASPHFAADVMRASHRAEVALIRQPFEPGRQ